MKWIRDYLKRIVIGWVIEDYRNNGELRQTLKRDEVSIDLFVDRDGRNVDTAEDRADRLRYVK